MKNKIQIVALAAVSLLTPSVRADEPAYLAATNNNPLMTMTNEIQEHLGHCTKASEIMGMSVKNSQDQSVGKVKDMAVDVEAGRILYVIVSTGGTMGMGGTWQAVPPGVLMLEETNQVLRLDPDISQINSPFEVSRWSDECNSNRAVEIYSQYHQTPYFADPEYTNLMAPRQLSVVNDSGSSAIQPPAGRLGPVVRASKVIGTAVVNPQGEKLGKVDNLMVNLPAGRIVAVILSSGGFMGMDGELSVIPPGAFQYDAQTNMLQLNATKSSLTNAPHFTSGQWPDLDQPAYAGGVYQAYSIRPYFNTNAADVGAYDAGTNQYRNADNSARNMRDRNGGTLTPLDQGTSAADINTTTQIRKQIVARNDLSVYARNIKIITRDGKVTLRGPVNSAEERGKIADIADSVAGGDNVDNQLEVRLAVGN